MPPKGTYRKKVLKNIAAVSFMVISLFAVAVSISNPLRQQLTNALAVAGRGGGGAAGRIADRAQRFQQYVDSQIRKAERASDQGGAFCAGGAACNATAIIQAYKNNPNYAGQPAEKAIWDAYTSSVDNAVKAGNDADAAKALDNLKSISDALYGQAVQDASQQRAALQTEQTNKLTDECNSDNTRGQYICTTPSGLQDYANARAAEAKQLLARIEIAPAGTYTNAQIDEYLVTLKRYVGENVISQSDYDKAANFVTASRATAVKPPTSQTATNTPPQTTANAVGGTTGTTVGVTGTAKIPTTTQTVTNAPPQTTANAVGGTTGTTVGVTGTAQIPPKTVQNAPLNVSGTSGGGTTFAGQISNFFTGAYNFIADVPKNIPIPTGLGLPTIKINIPPFIASIFNLPGASSITGSQAAITPPNQNIGQGVTGTANIITQQARTEELLQVQDISTQPYDLLSRNPGQLCYRGTCDGNKMRQLYEWYLAKPDGWWYHDGHFTPADFAAIMVMAEAHGSGNAANQTSTKIAQAIAYQLWYSSPENNRPGYCKTADCQGGGGMLNFLALYSQSAWERYNGLATNPNGNLAGLSDPTLNDFYNSKGVTLTELSDIINTKPPATGSYIDLPTEWGCSNRAICSEDKGLNLWIQKAINHNAPTGTTAPNGVYYIGADGEVVYTLAQAAYWISH